MSDGAEINPKLLALLVEVAALEAKRFSRIGHVATVPLEFGEQRFTLERFNPPASVPPAEVAPIRESPSPATASRCGSARSTIAASTESPRQQQGALDHVSQLADVAGPRVSRKRFDRFRREIPWLPIILQMLQSERVFNGQEQFLGRNRLLEKIDCAEARCAHRHFNRGLPKHHHEGRRSRPRS